MSTRSILCLLCLFAMASAYSEAGRRLGTTRRRRSTKTTCAGGLFIHLVQETNEDYRCKIGTYAPAGPCRLNPVPYSMCKTCPLGRYTDTVGASQCKYCPIGKYRSNSTDVVCSAIDKNCSKGYGWIHGATTNACVDCYQRGEYSVNNTCTKCGKREELYLESLTPILCRKIPLYNDFDFWTLLVTAGCVFSYTCVYCVSYTGNRCRKALLLLLNIAGISSCIMYSLYVFELPLGITIVCTIYNFMFVAGYVYIYLVGKIISRWSSNHN